MKKADDMMIDRDETLFIGGSKQLTYTPNWDRRRRVTVNIEGHYYSNDNGHFVSYNCWYKGIQNQCYELTQEEWDAAVKKYAHCKWL